MISFGRILYTGTITGGHNFFILKYITIRKGVNMNIRKLNEKLEKLLESEEDIESKLDEGTTIIITF